MTNSIFANHVVDCITKGERLSDHYSCDRVIHGLADHMVNNISDFEEACKNRGLIIESCNSSEFNILIKGRAKYYKIAGKRVAIHPTSTCFTIDD